MEKPRRYDYDKLVISAIVLLLGIVAFSCCIAAEFSKVKVKDMKLDGSLCSLPRSCAFGLGIAALVSLSLALIIGTTSRICSSSSSSAAAAASPIPIPSILLLIPSWVLYGLASVLLATASTMNGGQPYGKGWMNGDCYVVHDGVYAGAAVLVVSVILLIVAFNHRTARITTIRHPSEQQTTP